MEVGCGTGDVILSLAADFKHSLGLDINDGFLAYAKEQTPANIEDKVRQARCSRSKAHLFLLLCWRAVVGLLLSLLVALLRILLL